MKIYEKGNLLKGKRELIELLELPAGLTVREVYYVIFSESYGTLKSKGTNCKNFQEYLYTEFGDSKLIFTPFQPSVPLYFTNMEEKSVSSLEN
jgi:hypothetical protein